MEATTVKLFYLSNSLKSTAKKLEQFLRAAPTASENPMLDPTLFTQDCKPRIELLLFTDLIAVMSGDASSDQPQTDIVVILGHSNVFNFGSLAIPDIMGALLPRKPERKPPSLVVFLGCCGGNPRYGPLVMLSQLPEWQNTVFSFFPRRIYEEELCRRAPVLVVQYLLHLSIVPNYAGIESADSVERVENFLRKYIIGFCDTHIKSDVRYAQDEQLETAFYLNLKEQQTAQKILNIKNSGTGLYISSKEIPLSCWQLAMYHTYTAGKGGEKSIKTFIENTEAELESMQIVNETMLIAEIDKKCKTELEQRKLCNIIELSCELRLMQVTEETFELLRTNKWDKVDHLQFFVAMLQGYWGKNDEFKLIEYASHHLVEMMKSTNVHDNDKLHKYQLCCVGYCLFSPETYIISDKDYEICLLRKDKMKINNEILLCDRLITVSGYKITWYGQVSLQAPKLDCKSMKPLPQYDDNELPWFEVFDLCKIDDQFVKLYNEPVQDDQLAQNDQQGIPMRSYRSSESCSYLYKRGDLELALKALQDYCHAKNYFFCETQSSAANSLPNKYRLKTLYGVKDFHNKDAGYMQSFPEKKDGIWYVEMRVVHVKDKLVKINIHEDENLLHKDRVKDHLDNWEKVSRCRFVCALYYTKDNNLIGTLFFTDSHYGDDKVKEERIEDKLKEKNINFDSLNYFEKVNKLIESTSKAEWYDLKEEIVKEGNYYPFKALGKLRIKRTSTPILYI